MAEVQVEPSGSEVSKVESDITQTITPADTIVTLIREPVTLLYQNIVKGQQLKQRLGPWQGEAFDENTRCPRPVLRREEFEEYTVKVDGIVPSYMPHHKHIWYNNRPHLDSCLARDPPKPPAREVLPI
jgi:hypothetical protein